MLRSKRRERKWFAGQRFSPFGRLGYNIGLLFDAALLAGFGRSQKVRRGWAIGR